MQKNNLPWKKIILSTAVVIIAAVFLVPGGLAHADNPVGLTTCFASGVATCTVYYGVYIVRQILMSFFAITTGIFLSFLNLTGHLYDSPMVQSGFGICLSLANLAFVLGIIVIAVATIIHNQTYGIKQLLWKLVTMAILVNFGLVVTAPIFTFSNDATQNFITAAGGAGLGNNLARAMNPQLEDAAVNQLQKNSSALTSAGVSTCATVGSAIPGGSLLCVIGGFITGWGGAATDLVQTVTVGLAGQVVILAIMDFSLLAAAVLLLVRYVYLVMLIILLPFAWLAWVFPKYSHEFDQWWNNFIKWTFFPLVFTFFLYLAIQISLASNNNYLANSLSGVTGNAQAGTQMAVCSSGSPANCYVNVGTDIMDQIALCGLLLGGLFAASALAGKAGGVAVSMGKSASGAVTGYVGRKTKSGAQKTARLGYQKIGGEKINEALRENRGLQWTRKVPILGGMVRRGVSVAGRGLASASSDASGVEEAKKGVPKDREAVLANLKGSMSKNDTLAHLDAAVKGKYLREDTMVNGKKAKDYLDQNRDVLKRNGQGKTLEDANKLFMSDSNYRVGEKAATEKAARENTLREDARKKAVAGGANKEEAKKAGDEAVQKSREEIEEKAEEAHDEKYKEVYEEAKNGKIGNEAANKERAEGGSDDEVEAARDTAAKKAAEKAAELAAAEVSGALVTLVDDIKDDFGKVIHKAGDEMDAKGLMNVAMKQFIKGLTPEDAGKMDPNALFGPAAPLEAITTRLNNIALYNAKLMPNLYKNMKFATIRNMQDKYTGFIDGKIAELIDSIKNTTDAERLAEMTFMKGSLEKAQKAFEKIQTGSLAHVDGARSEPGETKPTPAPSGGSSKT